MTNPTQSDADLSDQLFAWIDAAQRRAANVARSAVANPISTGGDLLRGVAAGAAQLPFDVGAAMAPGIGLIAPAAASTFGPLADRTQAAINQSPVGTTTDAGALGRMLVQMLAPIPGAGAMRRTISLADLTRAALR
jgi:hypothetical protein